MDCESKKFIKRHLGLSRDKRTNAWSLVCPKCNTSHKPPTTMLRYNEERCPKCGHAEVVDYND